MTRRAHSRQLAAVLGMAILVSPAIASRRRVIAPADSLRDPALIMGTLPNGLRYYLRANRSPAHRAELRLVVDAGSVLEDDDQRGFAHFLEHMAFNGTTHFPHHDLVDFIETSGMRFGADLNAGTSADETVYLLTLPTDDGRILARGLDVLQDWASGGITIDSADVVAERGVVMGEWRTRLPDTASQNLQSHYDTLYFGPSRYLSRKPIGDTTLIESALPGPIRRFYHDWYRPELMTVVVVGDFDPARMEREVKRRFQGIPAGTTPRPRGVAAPPVSATPVIDMYRGNTLPMVEVLWPEPAVPTDAREAVRQRLVTDLLHQSLEERVLRIRAHPSRPFVTAELEEGRLVRPVALHGIQIIAWPDSLEHALTTVLTECERMARYGIPAERLAHDKAILLARLEHAAAGEAGRSSTAYADTYIEHALTGEGSLLSTQQALTLAREILPELTPDVLAQAARFWREPKGARVNFLLPTLAHVRPPTRERTLALFDSVAHMPIAPDSDQMSTVGPLLAGLPSAGRIVSERRDRVAGMTEWMLSNGAKVLFKPTQNDPDDVRMRAWSPGGFLMMPDSLFFTPGRMVARVMTDIGGLGTTRHDALSQKLATTGVQSMKVDISYAEESIQLRGSPPDLETLFQLMYLQFTAPMVDTAALAGWQSLAKYVAPTYRIDDQLNQILGKGNPRMLPVATGIAELATVKDLMAAYRDRFGNPGAFTFTLLGAVSEAEVRPLVERYLASLPTTGGREVPVATVDHDFLHRVDRVDSVLELPKAQTVMIFDGRFPEAPDAYLRERQKLSALTTVLTSRLRVRLRQELSGTYTPLIFSETYTLPEERYRALIVFDAAPERMRQLNRELTNLLDSVRTQGVTEAEAARAALVQRRQLETRLQDNDYWMATIGTYARLGIPLDKIPAPYPERAATPADLQDAMRRYLPDDVYIHLTAMPKREP